jgi:hypothetical protein
VREVGVVLPPLSAVPVPLVSGLSDGVEHTENGQPTPRRTRLPAEEEQQGRRVGSGEPSPKPSTKPSPRPSPGPSPSPRRNAAHGARSSNRGGSGSDATGVAPNQTQVEGGVNIGMPVPEARQDSRSASTTSVNRAFGQRSTKPVSFAGVATRASADVSSSQIPVDEELASFLGDAVRGKPVAPTVAAAAAAAAGSSEVDAKLAKLQSTGSELTQGQQLQLDAALEERTQLLNKLFEDQLKKQYETMRREASKLAKKHHKDVATLDDKFKERMTGIAGRFKQLDEEQAKHELVLKEVEALQETVAKLEAVADEQQARQSEAAETLEAQGSQLRVLGEQKQQMAARAVEAAVKQPSAPARATSPIPTPTPIPTPSPPPQPILRPSPTPCPTGGAAAERGFGRRGRGVHGRSNRRDASAGGHAHGGARRDDVSRAAREGELRDGGAAQAG